MKYGVHGTSYDWFRSYLDCRKQRCFINGSLSGDHFLTCGIPQGTILGPLLFIIYINDLPNCLSNAEPRMYADDTHISFASNNIENINTTLNVDLARVEKWLTAHKLTLNASKTEFMLIGSRQRLSTFHNPPSLMINGAPITRVTSTKCLGVHIDQTLSWNVHVENLCKKIASGIGALKRVRSFVPHETLRSIFMSLVQPHFDYCNSVWGCCGKTLASKLQKLQNRAARILTYSNYDANADNLIKKLGWIKLDSQRTIHKAVIRKYLDENSTEMLVHAFVSSKLDYCNALLIGLPKYQIDRLQSVLNTAARIITFTCKYDHITPVLVRLHWLPVFYRIRFKVLLLTYKALNDLSPEYISELLSKPKYTRYLRSQSQHLLSVPKSSTVTYGDRAFSVCAPKLWNELPFQLRMSTNIQAFKSGLKTMLFKMAYF